MENNNTKASEQNKTSNQGENQRSEDLIEQAKKLRQKHSTAEIILEDEHNHISKKTIVYITLTLLSLALLIFLFANVSTKEKMQERTTRIAKAISSPEPTVKKATTANEHNKVKPSEQVYGPFNATGETKNTKAVISPSLIAPKEKVRTNRRVTRAKVSTVKTVPHKRKRRIKKVVEPITPEREAYNFLLSQKKAFAGLVEGDSTQYEFQSYTVTKKGDGIFLFDFLFTKGTQERATHFFWKVDTKNKTILPIGLEAVRFDQMHIQ